MTIASDTVQSALAKVIDPEIRRPITDIGMVKSVEITNSTVTVGIYLTIKACPMQDTITESVRREVAQVPGVQEVVIELDVMSDEQRAALREKLQGPTAEIRFKRTDRTSTCCSTARHNASVSR